MQIKLNYMYNNIKYFIDKFCIHKFLNKCEVHQTPFWVTSNQDIEVASELANPCVSHVHVSMETNVDCTNHASVPSSLSLRDSSNRGYSGVVMDSSLINYFALISNIHQEPIMTLTGKWKSTIFRFLVNVIMGSCFYSFNKISNIPFNVII